MVRFRQRESVFGCKEPDKNAGPLRGRDSAAETHKVKDRFLISHSKQGEEVFSLFFCQNIRGPLTGAYRTCCRRD